MAEFPTLLSFYFILEKNLLLNRISRMQPFSKSTCFDANLFDWKALG
jgi:hypothetical protein